jgi:protein TonB
MSPTIPPNSSYTSITQSNHRSGLVYALLSTTFLFFTLGFISQIPPTFPPSLSPHEHDVITAKKPPLIPPEPPKPIDRTPEQALIPILQPTPQKNSITPIPFDSINPLISQTTNNSIFGPLAPPRYVSSIIDPSHLDTQPTPIIAVTPTHPYEKKKKGIDGNVLVEFLIDPTGRVVEAQIIKSSDPAFIQPTLKAIRKWTFTPALKDGKAVWTRARIPFEFSVNK